MKLFGFNDFAAKLPASLLGFGTILLTYFLTKELADSVWLPLFAMVVLMSTQYFMKYAGHAMTDIPYAFFFALAMFFYVKGLRNPRYLVLCGLPVALAVLTRSILGILPVGIQDSRSPFNRASRCNQAGMLSEKGRILLVQHQFGGRQRLVSQSDKGAASSETF